MNTPKNPIIMGNILPLIFSDKNIYANKVTHKGIEKLIATTTESGSFFNALI
jgi:hypothetical protein